MARKRKVSTRCQQTDNFKSRKIKKTNSATWLVTSMLGFSACLTLLNSVVPIPQSQARQSLLAPSLTFPSSQYQPIKIGSSQDIQNHDFSELDRLAANLNYPGDSIEELANLLTENTSNELEQARIIYAWITQHISYDVPAFRAAINNGQYPDVSPQIVLRKRTTICSGYSNLFFALAKAMDLEAAIIFGYAKGATPTGTDDDLNHAWNGVNINGNWYLLDATWGAGSVIEEKFTPQYKPYYFATKPSEFVYSHFPQDRGWQLLKQAYSRVEFDSLPHISSGFYPLGLQLVSHNSSLIKAADKIDIKLKVPANVFVVADLYQGQNKLPKTSTLITRKDDSLIVYVAPPTPGNYTLKIYGKQGKETQHYQQVITYQIEADKSVAQFPKTSGYYHREAVSLIEPLQSNLPSNSSVYFSLKVPYAMDVQVVNTQTNQWSALEGYGDYFQGYVDIKTGKNIVLAKFPGDDRYWHLLEYQ